MFFWAERKYCIHPERSTSKLQQRRFPPFVRFCSGQSPSLLCELTNRKNDWNIFYSCRWLSMIQTRTVWRRCLFTTLKKMSLRWIKSIYLQSVDLSGEASLFLCRMATASSRWTMQQFESTPKTGALRCSSTAHVWSSYLSGKTCLSQATVWTLLKGELRDL